MWTCNRLDLQINTRIDLNRLCPIQKSPRSLIPCRQLFDECLLWTMATWRRTWTMHILIAGVSPSSSSSSSSSRRCMFNYTNWDWAGLGCTSCSAERMQVWQVNSNLGCLNVDGLTCWGSMVWQDAEAAGRIYCIYLPEINLRVAWRRQAAEGRAGVDPETSSSWERATIEDSLV